MSDSNAKTIDKINQIKYKLNKYVKLEENNKIKDYLNALKNIDKINIQILKETEIVDCLKSIKKNDSQSDNGKLADEIIKTWKSALTSTDSKKSVEKIKQNGHSHLNDKSKSTSDLNLLTNGKKRVESSELKEAQSPNSKKPKISIDDYKVKKDNDFDKSKVKNHISSSSLLTNSSSNLSSKSANELIVPLPTVPLSNIISTSNLNLPSQKSSLSAKISSSISSLTNTVNTRVNMFAENEDEALTKIMSAKHSKRTLYTGKSNMLGAKLVVPKLYDLCVKALIPTLNSLHTRLSIYNQMNQFPVAFSLIKPVMEKADADQLNMIEYYCPNLTEDTDYLWEKICEKEFKKCERPEEDENWKDLYFRKKDEREQALERVRNKISSKQAAKPQERQTKIATVKFVSNGTSLKSSSSSVRTISSSGPVRQIIRDDPSRLGSSGGASGPRKTIQAPVMSQGMKATMKLIKKNMRR